MESSTQNKKSISILYPSKVFFVELPNAVDLSCKDVCPPSDIMGLDGTWLVVDTEN